jgi:hypothetical protein
MQSVGRRDEIPSSPLMTNPKERNDMADAGEFRESAQAWIDKINSDLLRAYLEGHSKEEAKEVLWELETIRRD